MADLAELRDGLLARVVQHGAGRNERVLDALRAVPRHVFLPGVPLETAYADDAVVTKRDEAGEAISSSSQPTMMALMLDQLGAGPGHRVLEIGAGTGYNAALLDRLVGPDGSVVTVDIDADLVAGARAALDAVGAGRVTTVCGDGALGVPDLAPYDRVIATVGASDLAPAWREQLAEGGRIVLPLDLRGLQVSAAFERSGGHWVTTSLVPCGFMRMRGSAADPARSTVLGDDPVLSVRVPDGRDVDAAGLEGALREPGAERTTGIVAGPAQIFDGLSLWLAAREPRWCVLTEQMSDVDGSRTRLARATLRVSGRRLTQGIVAGDSLAVLVRGSESEHAFPLAALGYGPSGDDLAADLVAHVRAWQEARRPSTAGLRIEAHPPSTPDAALPGGPVIDKPTTRLALTWDAA